MPARLPQEIRLQVIQLYIQGYSSENIAAKLNIAPQSVRNIIEELKRGDYPEYETFLPYLDDLRTLSRILRSKKRTLQQAITGITVFDTLNEMGVEPVELKEQIQVFQRVSPPDFPVGKFASAALRIMRLESETGLNFDALEARVPMLTARIAFLETKKKELEDSNTSLESAKEEATGNFERTRLENEARLKKEIQSLESSIRHLRSEEERQLTHNRVTEEQIARYVSIRARLMEKEFDIEKLGVLEKIINELSKYDWNPARIIDYLEEIKNLGQQTEIVKAQLSTLKKELGATNEEMQGAIAKMVQERSKLEGLQRLESECREKIAQFEKKMEDNNLRLDLADTLLALFDDVSKVKDEQLIQMAEKLELVVKTRRSLPGLPVDYQVLRDRLLLQVENMLGKKLVTREVVDELTRKHDDLVLNVQLGRLGKLEVLRKKQSDEKFQLIVERAKLAKEKEAFANTSQGELLALAASQMRSGDFHVSVCKKCGFRYAYALGSEYYEPTGVCPCCYSTLRSTSLVKIEE